MPENIRDADIETEAAILQLEALGLLEVSKDRICLTEKGVERAAKLFEGRPMDEMILIALYCAEFAREHDGDKD